MVVMEVIVGNTSGMINMCYPISTFETVLPNLKKLFKNIPNKSISKNKELKEVCKKVKLNLSQIKGKKDISLGIINNLKKGDILSFDKINEIEINKVKKFEVDKNNKVIRKF